MARKVMKRSLSKAGGNVAKKCKTIAASIRQADSIPVPVRAMLCDNLRRTFGTYKEERHAFQKTASDLVGSILNATQGKLQAAIQEAQAKKAPLDSEAENLSAANGAAAAGSDAAANALANSKTAVADSKTALKDAKSALHDRETEVKTSEAGWTATSTKKEKLEALAKDFLGPIKEGTGQPGGAAGKHVTKELASSLEPEFLTCVTRTFSKASPSWGTFDHIVDQRLAEMLKNISANLDRELAATASAKETGATNVEAAKATISGAEEKVKVMEEACASAAAAGKEADVAAKTAAAAFKQQQQHVQKAAHACTEAEGALTAFTNGARAAYTEVEARAAPPPEPVQEVEAAAPEAPAAQVAMAPAPAPAERRMPSILSSPAVLFQQARNLLPSPRLAPSPVVAQSPQRS